MRNEPEMYKTILDFANRDERVRAVILNGSRANPDAPRDLFQDYDIIFIVSTVSGFIADRSWISAFGEMIAMQTPDDEGDRGSEDSYIFLMQFTDGNRVDLTLFPADQLERLEDDSLSVLLLDKDGLIGELPEASVRDYLLAPPDYEAFRRCCNEFWWVSPYIAKGLWRRELSYARFMFERPVRDMLIQMLRWQVGVHKGLTVDTGKLGKYLERHLRPEDWGSFVRTFPNGDYDEIWAALFEMGNLFRKVAVEVAEHFDYTYDYGEDERVTAYLQRIKALPQDATVI